MLFKLLEIDNLSEIQEEVLKKIPPGSLNKNDLFYVNNSINYFLEIPALKNLLSKLELIDHIYQDGIALNITFPGVTLPIHYDSDKFVYSFNIPIQNCENTRVNLYKTDSTPVATQRKHPVHNTYVISRAYDPEKCTLIESHEVLSPCILNTRVPHNVVSYSNKIRIMLLVRLANSINSRFDIENHA